MAGTGRQVGIEGKINGAKYRVIFEENLLQSAQDWGEGSSFSRTMNLCTQPRQRRNG